MQITKSVSFGKVAAQCLGGTLFGILGMVPAIGINSPIIAGVGYLLGSSLGVYVIGNIGSTKGNFWFTLAGGTATELLFIILVDKSSDSRIAATIILGGIFAILSAEILTYHLTKPKINVSENISINFLDGSDSPFEVSNELKRISNYDIVYPMVGIKISF
ncbi:MAG: hypothetical protein C4539_14880 [Ignavibacteriales bacterium]|nr:MAG: hypothetical protein C4539_14880 [Ignavibacteriales bacterium]